MKRTISHQLALTMSLKHWQPENARAIRQMELHTVFCISLGRVPPRFPTRGASRRSEANRIAANAIQFKLLTPPASGKGFIALMGRQHVTFIVVVY